MKTPSELDRDPDLRIDVEKSDGRAIVQVSGEIDVYTAPRLRENLLRLAGDQHLIVDLTEVSFLDSTALGVLVGAMKRQREAGGAMSIVTTGTRIRRLFEITGLDRVFTLYDSVEAVQLSRRRSRIGAPCAGRSVTPPIAAGIPLPGSSSR
jgi:anti-sigma B factor antagonist